MLQDSAEGEMGEIVGGLAGSIAVDAVLEILTASSWIAANSVMKGLKLFANIHEWTSKKQLLGFYLLLY